MITTFKLYLGSINAQKLCDHHFRSILSDLQLDPNYRIENFQDGLTTNVSAIEIIHHTT